MMGYDEDETRKEYMEGLKNPGEHLLDDEDDFTMFDIALINRQNRALYADCNVRMGEIKFNRFAVIKMLMNLYEKEGLLTIEIGNSTEQHTDLALTF